MKLSLTIAGIVVVISIAFYFFRLYIFNNRLKKNGMVAEAVLLGYQEKGLQMDKPRDILVQLQVEPLNGKKFVTEIKYKVLPGEINLLKPGKRMQVRYNPANHKHILICSRLTAHSS